VLAELANIRGKTSFLFLFLLFWQKHKSRLYCTQLIAVSFLIYVKPQLQVASVNSVNGRSRKDANLDTKMDLELKSTLLYLMDTVNGNSRPV
jgi:hypothetical protein